MKNKICAAIAICCSLAIIGAVGALDTGSMSDQNAYIWLAIAFPVLVISMIIGGFFE